MYELEDCLTYEQLGDVREALRCIHPCCRAHADDPFHDFTPSGRHDAVGNEFCGTCGTMVEDHQEEQDDT